MLSQHENSGSPILTPNWKPENEIILISFHACLLTPKGFEAKTRLTVQFFQHKMNEYEKLLMEITELQQEVQAEKTEK